ncbi:MAG TPA: hypothetical protein VF519_18370 [Mycobacteriales bacterium]|jgi:hypothetical protein
MFRAAARLTTAALGAAVTIALVAAPASADGLVPDGCVGSTVYVCTGEATPPNWYGYGTQYTVPVALHRSSQTVQGTTVGGQQVGGVVVIVGGQTVPGVSTSVGGPTSPVYTGLVSPTNICLFVTCLVAGDPIVVPGIALPVVPVVVPSQTLPSQPVSVPALGTVPTTTTPGVTVPGVDQDVVTLHVYVVRSDVGDRVWSAAYDTCYSGGGWVNYDYWTGAYSCEGGTFAALSNALFLLDTRLG